MKPRLVFLVGPTASGKTAVSIALAKKLKAEVISCDSMQVYKGMGILSSKPSREYRRAVAHHCIDFVPLAREYNVSQYRKHAVRQMQAVLGRGKVPLFVGGTGLYMTILLDGIFDMRTEDPRVRQRLYRVAQRQGSGTLHQRLARVDPDAAAKIHPHDARRIIRALEVYEVTGKTITELQKNRRGLTHDYDVRIFCLDLEREELYRRIDARVEIMFGQGLVREVRRLSQRRISRTAASAIGIREVGEYLAGRAGLDEAKERMKQNTRNYARRQLTWFRKDARIEWIPVASGKSATAISAAIYEALRRPR